ncbi:hypothetical protein L1987_47275 [Smallanthus sonchifolius]|uniref:Uncharacterized protein n=1 Tax=Smallanthus sonchifolius TaxID=185202 RepID=A0ACB9G334_9ASTR|nr:hypothetical protein L1987_47275 [Smallanthus sonchifolius]
MCQTVLHCLMESPKITLLSELDISKDDFFIKVRVIRLWRKPNPRKLDETLSIEMILMDEKVKRVDSFCP